MEELLFHVAFYAYTIATALYLGYAFTKRESLAAVARWALFLALVVHVASLGARTIEARRLPQHGWYVPWSNWYESFSFFAVVIAVEYLILQYRRHLPILGAFVVPLVWASLLVAINSPFGRAIPNLPPALQSYWMAIHVPVMFVAYGAFANAFAIGLAYVMQERQIKSRKPTHLAFRLPPLDELDNLIYRVIWWAFPVLTLGILLGARWAYDAWGRYWGWDAKETWALITWLVYLIYLHMRIVVGWRGRKTAYLSLAGFAVVLFTYIGVNYLSELHGFLSGGGR